MNEDTADLQRFQALLDAHRTLPETSRSRTFMQISGYPHYENVCSNILAFYLEPGNEHGLGDLLLTSLLRASGMHDTEDFTTASVEREVDLSEGNRIDLLVTTGRYLVGIENKIHAELTNDLAAYSRAITRKAATEELEPVCILLGLHDLRAAAAERDPGFVTITYENLFEELKSLSGHYAVRGHSRYMTYLNDFIRTIEDLQRDPMTNTATETFFDDNHLQIERLYEQYRRYGNDLAARHIPPVHGLLHDLGEPDNVEMYVWNKFDLGFNFLHNGSMIALDNMVRPGGWFSLFWPRNRKKCGDAFDTLLAAVMEGDSPPERDSNGRHIVACFPLDTPHEQVAQEIRRIHQTVLVGLAELPPGPG